MIVQNERKLRAKKRKPPLVGGFSSRQGNRTPMPRLRILYPNHQMNRPTFQRCTRRENPSAAEGGGFEPPVREPVRQFSKLLVSATHPSFQDFGVRNRGVISLIADAKVQHLSEPCKFFIDFFSHLLFFLLFGAEYGTRTRDPRLGKPMLYQLSYYRVA